MKKSQKWLSVVGLSGAPLVLSLLSATVPKVSAIVMALVLVNASFAFGIVAIALLGGAVAPLVFGSGDFLTFAFSLL